MRRLAVATSVCVEIAECSRASTLQAESRSVHADGRRYGKCEWKASVARRLCLEMSCRETPRVVVRPLPKSVLQHSNQYSLEFINDISTF